MQGLERFDVLDLCSGWRKCNSSPPDFLDSLLDFISAESNPCSSTSIVHHSLH